MNHERAPSSRLRGGSVSVSLLALAALLSACQPLEGLQTRPATSLTAAPDPVEAPPVASLEQAIERAVDDAAPAGAREELTDRTGDRASTVSGKTVAETAKAGSAPVQASAPVPAAASWRTARAEGDAGAGARSPAMTPQPLVPVSRARPANAAEPPPIPAAVLAAMSPHERERALIVGVAAPRPDPAGAAAARKDAELSPLQVSAPEWPVGARWLYDDGYGLVVENAGPGGARLRRLDDPGQWQVRRGFLRDSSQSVRTFRKLLYRSIDAERARILHRDRPLVFTREYTANGTRRVHATSWRYEGRQRISVPAGDFDTQIVVMRTRNRATGWTGFERWWYSPRVGSYVRLEYRYGAMPVQSRVLVDYSLPAAAPVEAPAPGSAPVSGVEPRPSSPAGLSASARRP